MCYHNRKQSREKLEPRVGCCSDGPGHVVLGEHCENFWNTRLERLLTAQILMICSEEAWNMRMWIETQMIEACLAKFDHPSKTPIGAIHVIYLNLKKSLELKSVLCRGHWTVIWWV